MSSRTAASLHITNGDAVIHTFKKAGILGTHVPWRDVLHEGPVPGGVPFEECSRIRGSYLAMRGHGNPIRVMHQFETRDAVVRRATEFEEIVLWFEHDLYDQLQILQIVHVLGEMRIEPGRLSMIQSDDYLGSMTAEELAALHPKRRSVTAPMLARAASIWNAFTSSDPHALFEHTTLDAPAFPHMRAGLRRLCQEYPWTGDGLSRSHRQALAAVSAGPARNEELFRRAQAHEEAPFLGDTTFYALVDDLRRSLAPLVAGEEGAYEPTPLGRRVLAGDADWLEHVPSDRWIGGVHLEGMHPPRWDDVRQTFTTAKEAVDS